MRIGCGRSCFPQCLFKEGYVSGPRADCVFPGCISVHLLRLRRRLSPTCMMRVVAAPFFELISPRWRSYNCMGVHFTRTTWDLGSTSWSCLTQFSLSARSVEKLLRCLTCYFWLWQQVMAQHCNTCRCQKYQTLQGDTDLSADEETESTLNLMASGSDLFGSVQKSFLCLVRLLVDNTRFLTFVIPPLCCVHLIFSSRPSSTRSVMAGKHQLLHLFLLCRLFDLTFWAASDSINPGWNHFSGTYWPVTNQPISS